MTISKAEIERLIGRPIPPKGKFVQYVNDCINEAGCWDEQDEASRREYLLELVTEWEHES